MELLGLRIHDSAQDDLAGRSCFFETSTCRRSLVVREVMNSLLFRWLSERTTPSTAELFVAIDLAVRVS